MEIAIAMRESKDTSMGYGIPEAIKYPDGPDRAYGQTNGELSQMTKEQGLQVIVDDWRNDRGDLRPDWISVGLYVERDAIVARG